MRSASLSREQVPGRTGSRLLLQAKGEPHGFFNQTALAGNNDGRRLMSFCVTSAIWAKNRKVPLPAKASIPDSAPAQSHVVIKLDTKLLDAIVANTNLRRTPCFPLELKVSIWREGDPIGLASMGRETSSKGAFHIYPESENEFSS